MNRFLLGVMSLGLVVTAGCTEDPTEALRTGPARVVTSRTYLQLLPGDSASVIGRTLDAQGNAVVPLPEVISENASVATVSVDDILSGNPSPELAFFVKGINPGQATITATAEAVSTSFTTLVFPLTFPGTAAVNSSGRLDEVTLTADPVIEFDTSGTSGVLVDGASADILSLTASEMVFSWSAAAAVAAAEVTLTDVLFLGEFPLAELVLADPVALTQDGDEPANDLDVPGGGTPTTAAFGSANINRGSSASDDVRDFWCVTIPGGDTSFEVAWGGTGADADLDIFVQSGCSTAFDYFADVLGFGMATGANPEAASAVLPAGDYLINVEVYDPHDVPDPWWYQIRVFLTPA
jgi:hypothetical protein